jgi:hypothetical protein
VLGSFRFTTFRSKKFDLDFIIHRVFLNSKLETPNSGSRTSLFIGTSGYNYPHWWNGIFYPRDLPQRRWLEFYAKHLDSVELNVSFYRLPKKETFKDGTIGHLTASFLPSREAVTLLTSNDSRSAGNLYHCSSITQAL